MRSHLWWAWPLVLAAGCNGNAISINGDGGLPGGDNPDLAGWVDVSVEPPRNQVDVLFMVDNSPSMAPKQAELKARFPQLIRILDGFGQSNPADYHIGVVTSDLGAGPYNINSGQCHPGGDGARLQAKGAAADPSCGAFTDGNNFIEYNQIVRDAMGNPTSNLPAGQDLATTFGCMASVGQAGCGFEAQLESVYQALHDPIPENQGFLRDDALLIVVWVTDEDDCSADPNTDLFDPSQAGIAKYGALLSYRCTQHSIACDAPGVNVGPLSLLPYGPSGGPLDGCVPATAAQGNLLTDVQKYIDFFTQPKSLGGVKADPNDVVLIGITAPETPVESILANVKAASGPYQSCPGPIDPSGSGCAVVLQHSCIAPENTLFFGDPAVRIRAVINSVTNPFNRQNTSICDTSYETAIEGIGTTITTEVTGGCIDAALLDPSNPECDVEEVTLNADGSTSMTPIPECPPNTETPPCWFVAADAQCPPSSGGVPGLKLTVNPPLAGLPPSSSLTARCKTAP
jgi:hypothetical protein